MRSPSLLPTIAQAERFGGISYHLDGELVPALTVELSTGSSVYFEHHTLLWKSPRVEIGVKSLRGVFKRALSGMQIFMTEATGSGPIAFSRDGVGHIFPMHLKRGQQLHVREHQFLAATGDIDYTFERVRGVSNILFGGNGFFIDKFFAESADGIVWLHGYGNVFEVILSDGEQIDVEPGAWLYKDPTVSMATTLTQLATGLLASSSITMNRFTGPGRLGIQSMSLLPLGEAGQGGQAVGLGALALALLGGKRN
ncbi:MAG: AIM24 family protein [Alphaproteobacteria bacterium]|nr:AIM24 family protein [Alphaproteobacteria bacterium]